MADLNPEQLEALEKLLEGFDRLTRQARTTGDLIEDKLGKRFQSSMEKAMRSAEEKAKAETNATLKLNKRITEEQRDRAVDAAGKRAARSVQQQYNERITQGRQTLTALGETATKLTKRLYSGEQGAKVFAEAMDDAATTIGALTFLLGGPLIKALTVLTLGFFKLTKAASEQSDALFKSFQTLQQSGANAADGLAGVFAMMQNFSYGIEDLDKMTSMIGENARSLAMFRGSVADGARSLSGIGKEIKTSGLRREFMNMGMTIPEINESIAGYIDLQSRLGTTQQRDIKAITASVAGYVKETDAITRLTGATRKQQEDAQKKALNIEQFRYKYQKLMASNDPELIKQGQNMMQTFKMLSAMGPGGEQLAEAFASTQTGIVRDGNALGAMLLSNGRILEIVNDQNLTAAQKAEKFGLVVGKVIDPNGGSLGELARWGGFKEITGFDYGPVMDAIQSLKNLSKRLEGVTDEQERMRIIQEAGVKSQVGMRIAQMDSRDSMQSFVNLGVEPATRALETFSSVIERITRLLPGGSSRADAAANIQKQKESEKQVATGQIKPAELKETQKEFYDKMYNTLLEQAKKQGVANPEAIARLGAAQSSLETGYGKKTAGGNNYFGIKAQTGQPSGRTVATQEYDRATGQYKMTNARFRRYGNMEESAADYVKFLKDNPRYANVLAAGSTEEAILAQGRTGYATDPEYAAKLAAIHGGATQKMAGGGITQGLSIAGEAGPEAVVPLPGNKKIPVSFEAPSKDILQKLYGNVNELIPGMRVGSDPKQWSTELGSIAHQLEMAVTEMVKTSADPNLTEAKPGETRDYYDMLRMMLSTPEGKVWSAQNMIGVGAKGTDSEEGLKLREQYAGILEQLKMQDLAAIKADKFTGGSIEDPLSRLEVLAEDYQKRQADRSERGVGDWQSGSSNDQRLVDINQQVLQQLQELISLQRQNNNTQSRILQVSQN